jgi:hypothetical protein
VVVVVLQYVSDARIAPYRALCKNDADAIELHGEAMLIGSALLSTLAVIEIALRNRVHAQVAHDFGIDTWLTTNPSPVMLQNSELSAVAQAKRQAQQDRYSKLTNAQKRILDATAYPNGVPPNMAHKKLAKRRQEAITVTEGEVVAHTTLFFWKRFFAPEYEPTLWKRSVKRLFPNKTLSRADVSEHVETLYRARNRLAHHEPMHGQRLERAISSVEFIRQNLDCRVPSDDGPLCIFSRVQFENLCERKNAFDGSWQRLTQQA